MLQLISVYLLKTIIVSAVLILYYWFALRNKRFHYYNRFYLLSAVVLSIALPLLNLNLFTFSSSNYKAITMFNVMYADGETEWLFNNNASWFNWQQMLLLTALVITCIFLCMLAYRIIVIYRIKKKFPVSTMQGFDFINTDLQQAPFSFLKNIFWRQDISLEENAGRLILRHELTHIKQNHTWDKLFMQTVIAIFWINPLYRLVQKELCLIHEFIADDKAVTDNDTAAFAEMLLHAQYGKFMFEPAQPFFYSPIKRRLIMLTTSKEARFSYVRRIMALPLLACIVLLFAFRLQKDDGENVTTLKPGTAFKLVVDAGHGGEDKGAVGINGLEEKNITLAISKKIKELSGSYGIEVILTRSDDETMTPPEKLSVSGKYNPDAFISIHVNTGGAESKNGSGMEVFISPDNIQYGQSRILGSAILQNLGNSFNINTPLLKGNTGIWVLKANPKPAVLIECGYIDNAADAKIMTDAVQVANMAKKILEGVVAYANNGSKPVEPYEVMQESNAVADTIKPKAKAGNTNMPAKRLPESTVYVLNGEIKTKADIDKLDPKNIKSMSVLKDGEFAKSIYNIKGKQAAVIIITKDYADGKPATAGAGENVPLYVIDNIIATAQEARALDQSNILSVNVLKDKQAIEKYGEKGKNGAVEITTKNGTQKGNGILRMPGAEMQKLLIFGTPRKC